VLVYVAGLLGLLLTMLAGVPYLDFLRKNFYKQYIREDGPASHSVKKGTPTAGGIIIVIPSIIAAVTTMIMNRNFGIKPAIILSCFLLFMLLGFADDYSKITKKQNKGITGWQKLFFQASIASIPAIYTMLNIKSSISLFGLVEFNPGWLYVPIAMLIIIGSSNAVNLTDGLDGLAAGTSFFVLIAFAVIFYIKGSYPIAIVSLSVAGSCLGFLWYNKNPAQMFMGDTGSIALGGFLGTLAVIGKLELWLALAGLVFVIETLSVIIQVISFKTTGNRVFKMSPIHHHFELCGWSEKKVVITFWFFGFVCSALTCLLYFSR
jgi:phospho-N-acetylmuramoyl-pentapeptide-transferase